MSYRISIGRKYQFLLVIFITLCAMTFYYYGIRNEELRESGLGFINYGNNSAMPGFLVNTRGCRIPDMNPFDKSILKYIQPAQSVRCSDRQPLIESNQTSIWIVQSALRSYNVNQVTDLNCCYAKVERQPVDFKLKIDMFDNAISVHNVCQPFTESANVHWEFVQVTCTSNNTRIYMDYHAFVVPKKIDLASSYERKPEELSILIIGADSLSRLNFYRQMPKTKEILTALGAFEFFGYNKVHDNTFPNLVPLLSGYSVKELREICWFNDTHYFDECPWIWKNFSSKNYYTAFAEDAGRIGLFTYLKKGFINQPTDYYLRPFMEANEMWIGHSQFLNTKYCVGARFTPDVLFDYAYKFSVNMTLSNKKFWGFFWESTLTHDFLNCIPENDNIFFSLFKNIEMNNLLNTTAVIFMSDHGMRWGSIRETYQGRMEEHLPFLYILLPEWFKNKYKVALKNLKGNTHMLTTHFDVHETMKDLMKLSDMEDENIWARVPSTFHSRGVSLFLPIPSNRTCASAGIAPTWCTCQRSKEVPTSDKFVMKAAKLAVIYLNKLLRSYKECAKLTLKQILSARVETEEEMFKAKRVTNQFSDYVVTFVTKPGFAKLEATVRHQSETNDMLVLGNIARINAYGTESICIKNYRLKLYCYCI